MYLSAKLPQVKPRHLSASKNHPGSATRSTAMTLVPVSAPLGPNALSNHTKATVTDTIYPHQPGRVKYQGSWWRAACDDGTTVLPAATVAVTGRVGLTLIVQTIG